MAMANQQLESLQQVCKDLVDASSEMGEVTTISQLALCCVFLHCWRHTLEILAASRSKKQETVAIISEEQEQQEMSYVRDQLYLVERRIRLLRIADCLAELIGTPSDCCVLSEWTHCIRLDVVILVQ